MKQRRIASIGAGKMASALARGWVRAEFCRAEGIVAYDPSEQARERFAEVIPGVQLATSNCEAIAEADIVLLAVKPQQLALVANEIKGVLSSNQLVVSVAAGVLLNRLGSWFGTQRIVRVMPNMPCLVGFGASGFSLGAGATDQDSATVQQMMQSVGMAFQVEEPYLDSITGLSGSGPAYVYMVMEALADGGVRVGLSRKMALTLAAQTVRGAAEMVLAEGEHPAVLKDRVASPGGTTIVALQKLEEHGLRAALMSAVVASTERSQEMNRS